MILHHQKVGKGKILTVPVQKRLVAWAIRKKRLFWLIVSADGKAFRILQIFALLFVFILLFCATPVHRSAGHVYFIAFVALYLDDLITADTDKWKRWWEGAKNKVKWLWTPQMEPVPIPIR